VEEAVPDSAPLLAGDRLEDQLCVLADAVMLVDGDWLVQRVTPGALALGDRTADEVVGRSLWEAAPEVLGTAAEAQLRRAAAERRTVVEVQPWQDRWLRVRAAPYGGGLAIVIDDVTELKAAETRAARRARIHAALRRVATAVATETTSAAAQRTVCEEAAGLVGADAAWLVRYDGEDACEVLAAVGPPHRPPPEPGTRLELPEHGDMRRLRRTGAPILRPDGPRGIFAALRFGAAAFVPVRGGNALWGALCVAWEDPHPQIAEDRRWLVDLADLVGIALENAEERAALARRAATDVLTGLPNRRALHERLDAAIARARRHGHPMALALIDVDHFKAVNDGFGHEAGDEVLRRVAAALQRVCRREDVAARLGGDEFALVVDGIGEEALRDVAERVREHLRAPLGEGLPPVTVSIGLCAWTPGTDAETLRRRADDALYRAKLHGRDAVWLYDPDLPPPVAGRERAADLRRSGEVLDPSALQDDVRAARAFWRSALDALPSRIAVLDHDGRILAVNAAWEHSARRSGAAATAGVGADYLAACEAAGDDPDAAKVAGALRELLAGRRERFEHEYPCPAPAGPAWHVVRATGFAAGERRRVVVAHDDVTEQRLAQQRLLAARDEMRAVTSSMADGLLSLDANGRITYANPAAAELLGADPARLAGACAIEALYGGEPTGAAARLLAPAGEARADDVFARGDGSRLPVAWTSAPSGAQAAGRVVVFRDDRARKAHEERLRREAEGLRWANRLHRALTEERFVLHGQPIVDLRTGDVLAHELLLRLHDEDGTLVPPGAFLPAAEEHGLMQELDAWVVDQAARHVAAGRAVHCNLSAQTICRAGAADLLGEALGMHGGDPSLLTVEFTETALVRDPGQALAFAEEAHRLGCRVALDDFGTGYNSFALVKQLPVDGLKIDRQFVADLRRDVASASVVRAIIGLARDLGLETVAEGVEDEATLAELRALGATRAQGYLLGRPGPLAPAS
jgi:diguanylate cyclase (GGDEF)-like protein/PAS domain S-box-containing protein